MPFREEQPSYQAPMPMYIGSYVQSLLEPPKIIYRMETVHHVAVTGCFDTVQPLDEQPAKQTEKI